MINVKKTAVILLMILFASLAGISQGQTSGRNTSADMLNPDQLAVLLKKPKAETPVLYNVGPMDNIKGSINIGSASKKANLEKLRKALLNVPKDKMVVVYCGCCPMRVCPNVKPAMSLLKELGFKNPKILDLKQNLKVDWIDAGYPME
jgi:thiosulfate/3-mercaptopyruvate sulfurtransferase